MNEKIELKRLGGWYQIIMEIYVKLPGYENDLNTSVICICFSLKLIEM